MAAARRAHGAMLALLLVSCGGGAQDPDPQPRWIRRTLPSPTPRASASLVYAPALGGSLLFGGKFMPAQDYGFTNELWRYDGQAWTDITSTGPGPRAGLAFTFDEARGAAFLFGGWTQSFLADTWSYDGSWHEQMPAALPDKRSDAGIAYDTRRGVVILFGGRRLGPIYDDTWEWDGSAWRQLVSAHKPPSRSFHAMAYDERRDRVIVYGGRSGEDDISPLGDTWEWDGVDWRERITPNRPPPSTSVSLSYDSTLGKTILFVTADGEASTWSLDADDWSRVSGAGPGTRSLVAMAYDTGRERTVLFGGAADGAPLGDTWELLSRGCDADSEAGSFSDAACAGQGDENANVLSCASVPRPSRKGRSSLLLAAVAVAATRLFRSRCRRGHEDVGRR